MAEVVIGGKSVFKNALRNLAGQGLPLFVALFCIPRLISSLGVERFGFLTLIWVIVGYLSIFDFGLGQALTKLVGEHIGKGEEDEIPPLFWTTIFAMLVLGALSVGASIYGLPYLADSVLNMPSSFRDEAQSALFVAALSIPFVIISTGTRGVLEAYQQFGSVNLVRASLGIYTFVAPLVVGLYISNDLTYVACSLVIGRFVFLVSTFTLCVRVVPNLWGAFYVDRGLLRRLFGYGGWMTVANIIGPLMVYLDRFVIGSVISMSAVAYYVTPYEMVTKLWIIPSALTGALFSAFAINLAGKMEQAVRQFDISSKGVFYLMTPLVAFVILYSDYGLNVWLGDEFSARATTVLQILAVGVLINSYGRIPFAFIQAAGRPDLPAKLYLVELPLYLIFLFWALQSWGVEGAALAWVFRIVIDNVVLNYGCSKVVESVKQSANIGIAMSLAPPVFLLPLFYFKSFEAKVLASMLILTSSVYAGLWFKRTWRGKSGGGK